MARATLFLSLTAFLLLLLIPGTASAGWAGSRYDHSECTLQADGGGRPSLTCQSSFLDTFLLVDELNVPDASCPSGQRVVRREQTIEETWIVFDFYNGPGPLARFNIAGNESPVSSRLVSAVETSLGCAP